MEETLSGMGLLAKRCEVVGGCDPYINAHTHTHKHTQQDQSIDERLSVPRGEVRQHEG